jgi:hypothetical protein
MSVRNVWLIPRLLILFGLGCAAADAPNTTNAGDPGRKPVVDAKLTVQKAAEGEQRPRSSYLRVWYERRGNWDLVHVTNLGNTPAEWSGRIYEDGKGCTCMAPNMCIVGPACTNPNGGDTHAYANEHRCMPILLITQAQDVGACAIKQNQPTGK